LNKDTMSEEEQSAPAAVDAPKAKVPVVPLVLAVAVAAVLATGAVGGVAYWAIRTGKLPIAGVKTVTVVVEAPPVKTKLVPLDPLLVNLADPDGKGYLRVALTLKVEDPPPPKDAKPKEEKEAKGPPKNEFEAEERDAALEVLGKETSETLLAADGKEKLKADLKAALATHVPEVKVVDVLITEFLVQR
jgi:flagellar FliL protein